MPWLAGSGPAALFLCAERETGGQRTFRIIPGERGVKHVRAAERRAHMPEWFGEFQVGGKELDLPREAGEHGVEVMLVAGAVLMEPLEDASSLNP